MTTLRRKTNLNARYTRPQRRFLLSIAHKGQSDMTEADYAAGCAVGFTLSKPSWGGGKALPECPTYQQVCRAW